MASLAMREDDLPPRQDAGPTLMAISGVLMFFVLLTTFLRIFVRIKNHIFGWDDATILMSVACAITRLGHEIKQDHHGNGQHKVYLSAYDYTMINKFGWFGQIFLFSAVAFLKVSLGLLILRIKNTRPLRLLVYGTIAGVLITNFGVVTILLAECRPTGFWRGASAKCWPPKVRIYSIYATIAYSVVTDLIFSLLPLVVVWKVKIPMRTKMLVCGLMGLGLIATGFGVARAASLGIQTTDLSWMFCIAAIWSNVELFLGIICANLALSRSIWVYFFRSKDETTTNSQYMHSSAKTGTNKSRFATRLRGDHFEMTSTIVEGRNRTNSESKSNNSEIALVPGIQMKTEFRLSEEEPDIELPKQKI